MKFCIIVVLLSVSFCVAKPTFRGLICPDLVACFVDPCQVSRCVGQPKATCVSNYCGGCNALWYLNDTLVDCSATESTAPVEAEETNCVLVNCFVNPCSYAKCNKHPKAICQANYCGGCNAWFYVDRKRVECD